MSEHNLIRMPLIIIPLILAIIVGFGSGFVAINLPAEVECPEGTIKTQFGNNFECLTKQEPTSDGSLPIPTPSPIPTPKPQVAYKQPEAAPIPLVDQDPVIKCNWSKGSKCEGQSVKLRKSECSSGGSYVCCQVGDTWQLITSTTCLKIRQIDATYAETVRKINKDSIEKRKAIVGSFSTTTDLEKRTRREENERRMEKLRQDLEDFRNLTRSTVDSSIKDMEEARKRLREGLEATIKEINSRKKESEIKQKKESYDLCVGNVFTKYDTYPRRLRIERNNSLVKQYEDELAQCAFLYK